MFRNFPQHVKRRALSTLRTALTYGRRPDIDGREFAAEMQYFRHLPTKIRDRRGTLDLLPLEEADRNVPQYVRISATLTGTMTAAEKNFSNLKLIETYLRFTMVQECLNGLSINSITHMVTQ